MNLLGTIFEFLEPEMICELCLVCKTFKSVIDDGVRVYYFNRLCDRLKSVSPVYVNVPVNVQYCNYFRIKKIRGPTYSGLGALRFGDCYYEGNIKDGKPFGQGVLYRGTYRLHADFGGEKYGNFISATGMISAFYNEKYEVVRGEMICHKNNVFMHGNDYLSRHNLMGKAQVVINNSNVTHEHNKYLNGMAAYWASPRQNNSAHSGEMYIIDEKLFIGLHAICGKLIGQQTAMCRTTGTVGYFEILGSQLLNIKFIMPGPIILVSEHIAGKIFIKNGSVVVGQVFGNRIVYEMAYASIDHLINVLGMLADYNLR